MKLEILKIAPIQKAQQWDLKPKRGFNKMLFLAQNFPHMEYRLHVSANLHI